jgi:hypothetical protein
VPCSDGWQDRGGMPDLWLLTGRTKTVAVELEDFTLQPRVTHGQALYPSEGCVLCMKYGERVAR